MHSHTGVDYNAVWKLCYESWDFSGTLSLAKVILQWFPKLAGNLVNIYLPSTSSILEISFVNYCMV